MNSKQLKKLVKQALHDYMVGRMAFTSVDICNYLRSENPGEDIRMRYVSEAVRKNALNISAQGVHMYEVSYIKIDDGKGSLTSLTYLYHHIDFDINNYMSRDQVTLKTL